jgi:hypothetical protein
MPGGSKEGGGLEVKSAYKKQKFGEAISPFTMKGSPHKVGTIEGTSAYKASMAKLAASEIPTATVDTSRTSGDASIVGAFGEVGKSYVPAAVEYGLETGFKVGDSEETPGETQEEKNKRKYDRLQKKIDKADIGKRRNRLIDRQKKIYKSSKKESNFTVSIKE